MGQSASYKVKDKRSPGDHATSAALTKYKNARALSTPEVGLQRTALKDLRASANSGGHAAFAVLTNDEFFRQIVSWSAGWPGIIAFKLLPSLNPHAPPWREAKMTPSDALMQVADMRTLEAAKHTRWWDSTGQLTTFTLTDAVQALQAGNASAARYLFEAIRPDMALHAVAYRHWSAAVVFCRGHCDVLDVVLEFTPHEPGTRIGFSSDYMLRIQHVAVARWFVRNFGESSLPRDLIVAAVRKGYFGLYYYLRSVRGQDHEGARKATAPGLSMNQQRIRELINKVNGLSKKFERNQLLSAAAKIHDAELIEQVMADGPCGSAALREANEALKRIRDASFVRCPNENCAFHRSS